MDKDTALDMALEALEESETNNDTMEFHDRKNKAITAIKQALALDKKAENARELGLDYEPVLKDNSNYRYDPPHAEPVTMLFGSLPVQEPTYTTGHCKEKAQPGGCQLHNLHCGYPACDRKAANTLPAAQQEHEPENEPHVSLASVQEPYGYVWFTKHMEHRFTKMKPHPDMGAMDIRPVYTTPPAQPAVPDALTSADIQEHIEYVAGWNDCRAEMLKGIKP
jgi:hypothetical protein